MARILIDEPSLAVRDLLVEIVELLGHTPLLADEWDGSDSPDAAIVEPGPPSEYAAIRSLLERWPALPVVAVTIYPNSRELLELGVSRYVAKPFSLEALERAIADALASA